MRIISLFFLYKIYYIRLTHDTTTIKLNGFFAKILSFLANKLEIYNYFFSFITNVLFNKKKYH